MQNLLQIPGRMLAWMRNHWRISALILVILIGVVIWQVKKQQSAIVQLKFARVEKTNLTETLSVSGVVDAKDRAILRFATGGKLVYLGAQEGDSVKKGQTLAMIDASSLQKQLQVDLNSYFIQRMTFEQNQANRLNLASTDTLNRQQQQDQANLNNSVLNVQLQDITIQNTVLSSPIDGVLVNSPSSVTGVNLLGTDAFQIINPKSLVFKATVDQADISKVMKAQPSTITLDAYPDQIISSKVSYLSFTSAQTSTGTVYVVELPIPATSSADLNRYRIGMNGDASIILNQKNNVLAVPIAAVRDSNGNSYVKVKTGPNTATDRQVTLGIQTDTEAEILSGVKQGDEIVVP